MLSGGALAIVGLSALTSAFHGIANAQSQYGDQYWHERYHGRSLCSTVALRDARHVPVPVLRPLY